MCVDGTSKDTLLKDFDRPDLWIAGCEQKQIHTSSIIVCEHTPTSRLPEDDLWPGAACCKICSKNYTESNVLAQHPNLQFCVDGSTV